MEERKKGRKVSGTFLFTLLHVSIYLWEDLKELTLVDMCTMY